MKKIAWMLLLCLLLSRSAALAAVSVRMEEGALLLREDGEEIVPLGAYEDIVALGGGFFAARQDGLYLLMDGEGQPETEALYSDFRWSGEKLLACRDGMWTILDADGQEMYDAVYTRIVTDGQGCFWAMKDGEGRLEAGELFVLDGEGEELSAGLLVSRMADAGSEGLLAVLEPESGMWGYADARGELVIPAAFSHAGEFISGCAIVAQDGYYGVIDTGGAGIVPAEYDALEISDAGFILAGKTGEGVYLMDMTGMQRAFYAGEECFAAVVGEGFTLYDGRELRLLDGAGEVLEIISRLGSVYEGLNGQWILSDGAWGEECVCLSGTQARYQNLYPLGVFEGEALYACMEVNAARYASDQLGEIQLAVDMDSARYGVVNSSGEVWIECGYARIEYLGNGRLLLYDGGLWQMTDAHGNELWSRGAIQSEEPSF